jgi:hypothetical protein
MFKRLRPIMILLTVALWAVIPTLAQDTEETPNPQQQLVFDRVDQAMEHLNTYITPTPERPIARQFNYWSWSEQVWNDTSLACPLPEQTYELATIRGPRIVITFNDVDYVYHMNWDGSLWVLCGADGTALYRSDNPDATISTPTPPPATGFYTWAYDANGERLYLIHSVNGQIATNARPVVTNEAPDGLREIAFSPDGTVLFQVVTLNDGNQALSIFQTQTNVTTTVNADTGHSISLGFGDHLDEFVVVPRMASSSNNRYIAIGFSNESDPSINEWKVSIYDTQTHTFTSELTSAQFATLATGDADFISGVTNGAKRPVPQFIDNNGAVHFSLVHLFAGGSNTYPSASWNPATNSVVESPFIFTASDILANGTVVYTDYDPAYPEVGSGESMFPENNVIVSQNLLTSSAPEVLVESPESGIYNVWWNNNGGQIIYKTSIGADQVYKVYDPSTDLIYTQYGQTIGTDNGVLTAFYNVMNGTATIAHYTSQTVFNDIWASTSLTEAPVLLWTEFGNRQFGLRTTGSAPTDSTTTVSATPAPDACGELPSRVSVGGMGQTTEIEGIANFNLRETARLTAAVLRILPSNTPFTVTGGPTCSSGFTWWNITLEDGLSGWLAEGFEEDYYIAPISAG